MTKHRLILLGLGALFFASTLFLLKGDFFVSPDENAAFVFAKHWSETGSFRLSEPLNVKLVGLLHPRSAIGWGPSIVPVGFLGFFALAGIVGATLGSSAVLLVTPVLAILAIAAWRQVVLQVFGDKQLANLATFFLALHPAFWYYSGRVMMPNVAFLAFLIFALWLASREKRHLFLAGLCLGMAIFIRTSEVTWVLPVALILVVAARVRIVPILCGTALVALVMFAQNDATFGNPFTFGYTAEFPFYFTTPVSHEIAQLESSPTANGQQLKALSPLLPFGFHEMNIWRNVGDYVFKLYPWMAVPMLVGLFAVLANEQRRDQRWRVIVAIGGVMSLVLIAVYGSWLVIDNPDASIVSLGNSHVRYWLPLFAVGSLFSAYAFKLFIVERRYLAYVSLGLVAVLSTHLVFWGHDGFIESRKALLTFVEKRAAILEATESEAVVVVDRADKYLFPYRRVMVPLRSEVTYAAMPFIVEQAPLYYFGITLPEQDINYLNEVKLAEDELQIKKVLTVQEESLYSITRAP